MSKYKTFTEAEIQFIRDCAKLGLTVPAMIPHLLKAGYPQRKAKDIKEKCRKLGIFVTVSEKSYVKKEDEILFINRNKGVKAAIQALQDAGFKKRTKGSVISRGLILGFKFKHIKNDIWKAEELAILKAVYPIKGGVATVAALKAKGYKRTLKGVRSKSKVMDIRMHPESLTVMRGDVNRRRAIQEKIKQGRDLHALNI